MTYITHKLNSTLHRQGEACMVALDISKAFDRVWHAALISKCRAIGLSNTFTNWIENFLSNRLIQVLVDGYTSDSYKINAGVPQGSVLSPTLFIIFINDLLSITSNPIHSYADDSTLVASYDFDKKAHATTQSVASSRNNLMSSINNDLSIIYDWGNKNQVNFNASKTQCCLISRKPDALSFDLQIIFQGEDVERSQNLNLLGSNITYKLLWGDHVFSKAKKAAKMLGFLNRCRSYFSSTDLLKIYKAYIRSKMEDNSHLWAGAPPSILKYLDQVQSRAIRLINDESITASLAPLGHRRNVGALTLLYRYFVGCDSCSEEIKTILPVLKSFTRHTRQAARNHPYYLSLNTSSTDYYENSFIIRTSKLWNHLPPEVFPKVGDTYSYNLQRFKANVNKLVTNISNYPSLSTFFPSPA
jgi:archaellum component FlaG (FlaF/FlaG flagellin family)